MDLTLDRISTVWENLHGESSNFTIVVAGTNGKGSSISMLDAVYQHAGKITGAYTSPHLVRFNERITINGIEASDSQICNSFCEIEHHRKKIPLTYFEYGTLCALMIFQDQKVDIALLEVGMGGRLDAVNIVENDVALITAIGIDHEQWLGSSRDKIAEEKAGVIKQGGIVVCADPDPPPGIAKMAADKNATLISAPDDYKITHTDVSNRWSSHHPAIPEEWRNLFSIMAPFSGEHQISNLAGVIATLALSSEKTGVTVQNLKSGLASATLSGRCQVLFPAGENRPEVIADVAHNADSARELAKFLDNRDTTDKTYAVFGILGDKALDQIVLPMKKHIDFWVLATIGGERGQTAHQLAEKLGDVIKYAQWYAEDSAILAYKRALQLANPEDRIVIFGSFYTVGDIIHLAEQSN